jgi:hypothetical protein
MVFTKSTELLYNMAFMTGIHSTERFSGPMEISTLALSVSIYFWQKFKHIIQLR